MIPAQDKQGNDMTSPNNDTGQLNQDACELSFEELEQVSGGFDVLGALEAAAKKLAHVITGA
jgi:bacteriocin-like protein